MITPCGTTANSNSTRAAFWRKWPKPKLKALTSNPSSLGVGSELGHDVVIVGIELTFGLESFWKGDSSEEELQQLGAEIRQQNWQHQAGLDFVPVGDFSFYDQVLVLGDAFFTQPHCLDRHFVGMFFHQPPR